MKQIDVLYELSEEFNRSTPRDNSGFGFSESEILNIESLNLLELYRKIPSLKLSEYLISSEIIAKKSVKEILKKTFENIIDIDLEKKKPFYSIKFISVIVSRILTAEFNKPNESSLNNFEDEEPATNEIDSWLRGKMQVITIYKEQENQDDNNTNRSKLEFLERLRSRVKSSSIHSDIKPKKKIEKEDQYPPILNLGDPFVLDKKEEELRNKKFDEIKKIEERRKKERERIKEWHLQQIYLQKQIKESKAKNFTYNFDGKNIVFVHNVKTEHFPPQNYPIKY